MKEAAGGSSRQRARRFLVIGFLFMLAGTAILVVSIYLGVSNLSQSLVQLVMPGAYEIEFHGPGIYTAFHETTNDKKEAGYGTLPINPPKRRNPKSGTEYLEDPIKYLTCIIKSVKSGVEVPLDREFSGPEIPKNIFPYFLGKRTGFPFFLFTIDEPGKYIFSCQYPKQQVWYRLVISFGPDYEKKMFSYFILPLALFILAGSVGLILVIVGLLKRKE